MVPRVNPNPNYICVRDEVRSVYMELHMCVGQTPFWEREGMQYGLVGGEA